MNNKINGIIITTLKKCYCFRCYTERNKYYNLTNVFIYVYIKLFAKS